MSRFERAITSEMAEWMRSRRTRLNDLRTGLGSGDFSGIEETEIADPDLSNIEEALTAAMEDPVGSRATMGFAIGHHTQRGVLASWKRTERVRGITRSQALALALGELEDGGRRDRQLENLILIDDVPEGIDDN